MKPSHGNAVPGDLRREVITRDGWHCVCERAGFPSEVVARCPGTPDGLDHVRASHGMGMKSETALRNLVTLSNVAHDWKTRNGRIARPLLIAYIESLGNPHDAHVDIVSGCEECFAAVVR